MNDGSPLFRARFQWQPTRTAHDPDNILTLENAPVVYTVTGDVALTFAVASPLAVTYAEPVDVALSLGVASPQTATFAITGDVELTFGVSSAFEYVAGTPPVTRTGGARSFAHRRLVQPKPKVIPKRAIPRFVFEHAGAAPMPTWKAAAAVSASYATVGTVSFPTWEIPEGLPISRVMPAAVAIRKFAPSVAVSVSHALPVGVIRPRVAIGSHLTVIRYQWVEEEELLLVGAL